jgi:hypothetical protein
MPNQFTILVNSKDAQDYAVANSSISKKGFINPDWFSVSYNELRYNRPQFSTFSVPTQQNQLTLEDILTFLANQQLSTDELRRLLDALDTTEEVVDTTEEVVGGSSSISINSLNGTLLTPTNDRIILIPNFVLDGKVRRVEPSRVKWIYGSLVNPITSIFLLLERKDVTLNDSVEVTCTYSTDDGQEYSDTIVIKHIDAGVTEQGEVRTGIPTLKALTSTNRNVPFVDFSQDIVVQVTDGTTLQRPIPNENVVLSFPLEFNAFGFGFNSGTFGTFSGKTDAEGRFVAKLTGGNERAIGKTIPVTASIDNGQKIVFNFTIIRNSVGGSSDGTNGSSTPPPEVGESSS